MVNNAGPTAAVAKTGGVKLESGTRTPLKPSTKKPGTQRPPMSVAARVPLSTTPETEDPSLSVKLPADFAATLDAEERKARFLELLLPLVEQENGRVLETRKRLLRLLESRQEGGEPSDADSRWLETLARNYRVNGDPGESQDARWELLKKVDAIPTSLALAQAANESAWGGSRFARDGQNLFGIWTYDKTKGIVPKRRNPGKKHLVRRFEDLNESVRYYLHTLNSHPAYKKLRELRDKARQQGEAPEGILLAEGLVKYSAKGLDYVRTIQDMIEDNGLDSYDGIILASR